MIFFLLLDFFPGSAQSGDESAPGWLTMQRTARMEAITDSLLGSPDSLWFMGIRYPLAYIHAIGSPYFYDLTSTTGTIRFNHTVHPGQTFLFDLERDELVLLASWGNGTEYITLNRGWVDWVDLEANGMIVRLITENHPVVRSHHLPGGYYEIIHSGDRYTLLAKHRKRLEFHADQSDYNVYAYTRQLQLIKEGKLHDVSKERWFLKQFPVLKRELKNLRKASGTKYQEASSEELRHYLEWCEEREELSDKTDPAP